jgi:hypothetical protein
LLPCFYQFCCLIIKVIEGLLHSYHQFCAVVVGVELLHFLRLFQYFGGIPEAFFGNESALWLLLLSKLWNQT